MTGWRSLVLTLMRVPHDPSPPPGNPPRTFRASRNYFSFRLVLWWIGHAVIVIFLLVAYFVLAAIVSREAPQLLMTVANIMAGAGLVILLIRFTFGYAVMRLDYELRWYMISDRAIRIREGIITVREKTIALANIQNTVVKQGPLQRLFGIADVHVTTAGGAGSGSEHQAKSQTEPFHVGVFRGVDNPQELRTIIVEGVRRHQDSGLGDPDDNGSRSSGADDLLRELQLTRAMLETYNFL